MLSCKRTTSLSKHCKKPRRLLWNPSKPSGLAVCALLHDCFGAVTTLRELERVYARRRFKRPLAFGAAFRRKLPEGIECTSSLLLLMLSVFSVVAWLLLSGCVNSVLFYLFPLPSLLASIFSLPFEVRCEAVDAYQ